MCLHAADVAGRHAGMHDKKLVTAFVEDITWIRQTHPLGSSQDLDPSVPDLLMNGQVRYLGCGSAIQHTCHQFAMHVIDVHA